jgi:hypothetical protein
MGVFVYALRKMHPEVSLFLFIAPPKKATSKATN